MAKIGIDVVTMLALTGEVMLSPMVKQHWLHTSPKSAAPAKMNLSRVATCSLGRKNEVSQKSSAPPATLNDTMTMPSRPCVIASFPMGDISPQMAHAMNMLKWA